MPIRRNGLPYSVPPGSENRAKAHEGSPGTWETRPSPPTIPAREPEHQLPGAHGRASRPMGAKRDARVVSPNEGNEVRREGRTGVGAPHITTEAGEPSRGTRRRKGGAVSRNRWGETWRVHWNPWACPRNNNGSHNSLDRVRRWDSRLWPTSSISTG